jgi:saccharopepsin
VQNTTTLVETLLWNEALDAPGSGLFYGTDQNDNGTQDGVLTIGGSHEEKYANGDVVFTSLMKDEEYQLWRAPLCSVNVLVARKPSDSNSTVELHNGRLPTTALPAGSYPHTNKIWPYRGSGSAVFDPDVGRISFPDDIVDAMYFNLGWNLTNL